MDEKEHLLSKSTTPTKPKSGWRAFWGYDCLPFIPARYTLALVSCLGFINVYALRVNLSVAIVQMANSTATLRNSSAEVFTNHAYVVYCVCTVCSPCCFIRMFSYRFLTGHQNKSVIHSVFVSMITVELLIKELLFSEKEPNSINEVTSLKLMKISQLCGPKNFLFGGSTVLLNCVTSQLVLLIVLPPLSLQAGYWELSSMATCSLRYLVVCSPLGLEGGGCLGWASS